MAAHIIRQQTFMTILQQMVGGNDRRSVRQPSTSRAGPAMRRALKGLAIESRSGQDHESRQQFLGAFMAAPSPEGGVDAFWDALQRSGLLSVDVLAAARAAAAKDSDPKAVARELVKAGTLTRWQAGQ